MPFQHPVSPQPVDRPVPRHRHDPRPRVVGNSVGRPAAQRGQVRILNRVLGESDVAEDAGKQRDIALLVASIGDTKLDSGDNDGALAAYRESLAIRQQLAAADPSNTDLKRDVAATLSGIGDALLNAGDKPNALAAY